MPKALFNSTVYKLSIIVLVFSAFTLFASSFNKVLAATSYWYGSQDYYLSSPQNWDLLPNSGDDLIFLSDPANNSYNLINNFAEDFQINSILLQDHYAISGADLNVLNRIDVNAPDKSANIDSVINLLSTINLSCSACKEFNLNSDINLGNNSLVLTNYGNINVNGSLIGSGNIYINNAGGNDKIVTFGNNNNFKGDIYVFNGILKRTANLSIIPNNSNVDLSSDAVLDLDSYSETVGSITGSGEIKLGKGYLATGYNNNSGYFSGIISGEGGLTKRGTGNLSLWANNSYSGTTNIVSGALYINGSQSETIVRLSGGTLGGSGTIGGISAVSGVVTPGAYMYPAILKINGRAKLSYSTTLQVDLNGTAVGSEYDQLKVQGDVHLASANLSVQLNYVPAVDDSYIIIKASGNVTGTFSNLPEGSTFSASGYNFMIHYDTNSVVLTVVEPVSDQNITVPEPTEEPIN